MFASTASSSSEDDKSESSTVVYDHEPFEQYVARVKDLVQLKWPTAARDDITVERLKGGGYNRIVGFSIQDSEGAEQGKYVLRIPRFEAAQVLNDLTPLQFMRRLSNLPVPEVVAFDYTNHNVLEDPYMIQRRIHGRPLTWLYAEVSHQIRFQIARRLGEVIACLTSLRSPHIGRLTSASHDLDGPIEFLIPLSHAKWYLPQIQKVRV